MSGGIVVDNRGALCGVACTGWDLEDDAPPIGYVSTLWPILKTSISADRGDAHPRGIEYPVIELALAGVIRLIDLETLDPRQFPGYELPKK